MFTAAWLTDGGASRAAAMSKGRPTGAEPEPQPYGRDAKRVPRPSPQQPLGLGGRRGIRGIAPGKGDLTLERRG